MSLNILVVDDSEITRAVLIKTLKVADIEIADIFQAANGQEGLDILEKEWIDLIFADINMPVMNGLDMIDRINKNEVLEHIPKIVISTERSQTRIDELRSKGVSDYITKPFNPEQIKKVIDIMLEEEKL